MFQKQDFVPTRDKIYKKKNLFVYVPAGLNLEEPYTIWLYFHGQYDKPGKSPYWKNMKASADQANAVFVSSYLGAKPRAAADPNIINNAISLMKEKGDKIKIAEPSEINAYGFSAGGFTMSNFMLNGDVGRINKFMFLDAIYPRWRKLAVRAIEKVGAGNVTIVWIPTGGKHAASAAQKAIKELEGVGVREIGGRHSDARFIRENTQSNNINTIFEGWRKFLKESRAGRIVAIFGPSGSGKSRQKNIFKNHGWKELVSLVTRPPRNESDVEYEFTTEEDWQERDNGGELLNTNEYGGNYYGTKLKDFINADKAILVTDETSIDGSKGGKDLKIVAEKYDKELILVFSAPPDEDELQKRHRDRLERGEYKSQEEYEGRLSRAKEEAKSMQEKMFAMGENLHIVHTDEDVKNLIEELG